VQRAKERAAKEVAERLQRQVEEEDMKRKTGAAIAPPKELADDDSPTIISQSPINFEPPSQFGKSGSRGNAQLSFANCKCKLRARCCCKHNAKVWIPRRLRLRTVWTRN
jgi:hypothetical protein